jgi:hypothetical protein
MARKKSIKQKQKQQVSQKVNVKVIVGDKGGKSKRRPQQRRRREEPQVETISSKTLAPVFIQPPVVSLQSNYADAPRSSVTLPSEVFVAMQPQVQERTGKRLGGIPREAEDLRPVADPLKLSSKEMREDIDFITPVKGANNLPEGYGMFYNAPLRDTRITPNAKIDNATMTDIDYQPPSYVEDKSRDITAYSSGMESVEENVSIRTPVRRKKTKKQILLDEYAQLAGYSNADILPSSIKRLTINNLMYSISRYRDRPSSPSIITETEALFK